MNSESYFMLGCKLFGIYCLLAGIQSLVSAMLTFISIGDIPAEIHQAYFVRNFVIWLTPFLFIICGLYLLSSGKIIYNFAYKKQTDNKNNFEEMFILSLKLFGIYLIIGCFPILLTDISGIVTKMAVPSLFQIVSEHEFSITDAISNLVGLSLGFYLLRSGKWFMKYGKEQYLNP